MAAPAWDPATGSLRVETILPLIRSGALSIRTLITAVLDRIDAHEDKAVWIHRISREDVLKRVTELEKIDPNVAKHLPLYGIPYAVKDNIDVAGMPCTAACPEFSYVPEKHATSVRLIEAAGGVNLGKTNLDQFASGLVGTRSPYGHPHSAINKLYTSGGSSSGSGVAVGAGLVSFALGTDTAGSGRVPAAMNNVVGFKPTKGVISAAGVVAAARQLDCVAVFALTCEDARYVFDIIAGPDADDRSREDYPNVDELRRHRQVDKFAFGVPKKEQLKFFGNAEFERLYGEAIKRMESLGGTRHEFDYSIFTEAALMLYTGPPLAERLAFLDEFFAKNPDAGLPLIRQIIEHGYKFSAVETYKAIWRLAAIRKQIRDTVFNHIDVLLLPTTGTIYTQAEVLEHPISYNSNYGYYTNFVNLLDLCGVAVPNGFTKEGLPAGITIMSQAFHDEYVLELGARYHRTINLNFGATKHGYAHNDTSAHRPHHKHAEPVITIPAFVADGKGVTHIEKINKGVAQTNFNGDLTSAEPAASIFFRRTPGDWAPDWHHPPRVSYIIQLEGTVEMTAKDGTTTTLKPGDVVKVTDVGSANGGHKSKAIGGPTRAAFITLP